MKQRAFWIWFLITFLGIYLAAYLVVFFTQGDRHVLANTMLTYGFFIQIFGFIPWFIYRIYIRSKTPLSDRKSAFRLIAGALGMWGILNGWAAICIYVLDFFPSNTHPFSGSGNYGGFIPLLFAWFNLFGGLIISLIIALIQYGSERKRKRTETPGDVIDAE